MKALILYPLHYLLAYDKKIKQGDAYVFTIGKKVKPIPIARIIRLHKERYVEYVGVMEGSVFEFEKQRPWPEDPDNFIQFKAKDGKTLTLNKKHVRILK